MESEAAEVLESFVAAYRPYLESRLAGMGLAVPDDAVVVGERWLRTSLQELLSLPFSAQRRTPLEVFQEAMRFPTEALAAAGALEVVRDPVSAVALPGDVYDLAPASSQALGESAWSAHLVWGAAKAGANVSRGLSAIHVSRNLLDASRVREAADRAGYELTVVTRRPPGDRRHTVAFVDLELSDADEAVRILAATCGRVVAYGPHVDEFAMVRALSLGADEAIPRSRFFSDPGAWLPAPV